MVSLIRYSIPENAPFRNAQSRIPADGNKYFISIAIYAYTIQPESPRLSTMSTGLFHSFCAENAAIPPTYSHKLWTNCVVEFTALSTTECKPVDILSDHSRLHVISRSIYLTFNVSNAISPLIRPLRAGFCGVSCDLYCKIISSLFRIFIHLYFSDFGLLFCIYAPFPTAPRKSDQILFISLLLPYCFSPSGML